MGSARAALKSAAASAPVAGYDVAVFLVGSPSFTFQSAASSVARVLECFEVGECVAYYSAFAKREAERVREFAGRVAGAELELRPLPRGLREAAETLRSELEGRRGLAVPTSGSLLGAVALTVAACRTGASVGHVLFPFGPWRGLFYPYVPRYLQPIQVLGERAQVRGPNLDWDGALRYLGERCAAWPRLLRRVAEVCVELNRSLPQAWVDSSELPALALELRVGVEEGRLVRRLLLKTGVSTVELLRLPARRVREEVSAPTRSWVVDARSDRRLFEEFASHALAAVAGAERCEDVGWLYRLVGFELLDLPEGRYVIDTNLVYQGVHNLARPGGPAILVPYCVHAEILNRVAESKRECDRLAAEALLLAYELLEWYASRVPSEPYRCDVSIPAIDPELVRGSTVLTSDRRAYELWRRMALSSYARVEYAGGERFRGADEAEAHFALIQLAAILVELAGVG